MTMTESRRRTLVGGAAIAVALWSGYGSAQRWADSRILSTSLAEHGLVSLQLARTSSEAGNIKAEWQSTATANGDNVLGVASRQSGQRRVAVAQAVVGLLLGLWWAGLATSLSRAVLWYSAALVVVAGLVDVTSAVLLDRVLSGSATVDFDRAVRMTRLASMAGFALALVAVAIVAVIIIGAVRARLALRRDQKRPVTTAAAAAAAPNSTGCDFDTLAPFRRLIEAEKREIFNDPNRRSPDSPMLDHNLAADEPFVAFRAADTIGLALSGGGIRSATFNLGLLQGLNQLKLLPLFDYVSTVSGGGYVGAFWSEWLVRVQHAPGGQLFPLAGDGRQLDSPAERHLREFSGFLAPRWGFFEVETWTAIVTVVAGLVPALAVGLSVIGLALITWLAFTFAVASPTPAATASVLAVVTALTLHLFERAWRAFKIQQSTAPATAWPQGDDRAARRRYLLASIAAVVVAALLQAATTGAYATFTGAYWPVYVYDDSWQQLLMFDSRDGLGRWWLVTGIASPPGFATRPWIVSPRLFDFGVVWLGTALLLSVVRLLHFVTLTPGRRDFLASFDRVLMRIMALGLAWIGVALVWQLAMNLAGLVALTGAAVAAGGFAALRNWIGTALHRREDTSVTGRLKPYLPQLLAYVAIVLSAVVVSGALITLCGTEWIDWWWAAALMAAWVVVALFIDPTASGLHAFYRERISRAYSGACNAASVGDARTNRQTEPQLGDDRPLGQLVGRPLHLVCCAANDLQGDTLGTLARGARSAVLSKHGFAMGTHFGAWAEGGPTLGSAVTASAAAFNSNMGTVSMQVGPAVSFLMTMLNLRLGLWLRHPAAERAEFRRWPGLLLFREMFGWTSASGSVPPAGPVATMQRDVHLSDGGHFENLALYELVRRHCRYILLSDCAADPEASFSDLGNAMRRIRADFGVDITLDVSPLLPKDGRSRQYLAVGTIHYSDVDRGILLYVKPTLVGEETTDVLQYKARNPLFPQEGTGDQFYDEAQWESYRRLGQQAVARAFDFIDVDGVKGKRSADWVFAEAAQRWGAIPAGLEERVLEMTNRFGALESELQQRPAMAVFAELFPEMAAAQAQHPPAAGGPPVATPGPVPSPDPAEAMAAELGFLLRATQLMEDVWTACELDVWWKHPLNIGWINLFARWTTAPTFIFWWPVLAPMFTPGFRQFLQQRFPLRADVTQPGSHEIWNPAKGMVQAMGNDLPATGLAVTWWRDRATQPIRDRATLSGTARIVFANMLDLDDRSGGPGKKIKLQTGLAIVTFKGSRAGWTSDDFFVPPSLWGAGIGWYFLTGLLTELAGRGVTHCHVAVPPLDGRPSHLPARQDRLMFIDQYRKVGFREHRPGPGNPLPGDDLAMCHALECDAERSTVLVLDVQQWARHRKS